MASTSDGLRTLNLKSGLKPAALQNRFARNYTAYVYFCEALGVPSPKRFAYAMRARRCVPASLSRTWIATGRTLTRHEDSPHSKARSAREMLRRWALDVEPWVFALFLPGRDLRCRVQAIPATSHRCHPEPRRRRRISRFRESEIPPE